MWWSSVIACSKHLWLVRLTWVKSTFLLNQRLWHITGQSRESIVKYLQVIEDLLLNKFVPPKMSGSSDCQSYHIKQKNLVFDSSFAERWKSGKENIQRCARFAAGFVYQFLACNWLRFSTLDWQAAIIKLPCLCLAAKVLYQLIRKPVTFALQVGPCSIDSFDSVAVRWTWAMRWETRLNDRTLN